MTSFEEQMNDLFSIDEALALVSGILQSQTGLDAGSESSSEDDDDYNFQNLSMSKIVVEGVDAESRSCQVADNNLSQTSHLMPELAKFWREDDITGVTSSLDDVT